MNTFKKILYRFQKLNSATKRFPLAILFFVATFITLAVMIGKDQSNFKLLFTFIIGGLTACVTQMIFERFGKNIKFRFLCMASGLLITLFFYLFIINDLEWGLQNGIKSVVFIMFLVIAFIWVPVIKNNPDFNQSFLVVFKSFFQALLYTAVLFLGIVLVITAIDILLISVNEKLYLYSGDFIFTLLFPILFLSMIPVYPGVIQKEEERLNLEDKDLLNNAVQTPKILRILVSYIMIPLAALYTLILVLYLVIHIKSDFWNNNLLEPLLITYIIVIIILYLLASTIENKIVILFRTIFPKILIPIVAIQIIASVLDVINFGMIHTKYFVIVFGIFSICASIFMSIRPIEKNEMIALLFLLFSAITVVPFVDAFDISVISQRNVLEKVLVNNDMLKDNEIVRKEGLSEADKRIITNSIRYLDTINETKNLPWLPAEFSLYEDFYETFGFYEYDSMQTTDQILNLYTKLEDPLVIKGYDYLVQSYYNSDDVNIHKIGTISHLDQEYNIQTVLLENGGGIEIRDKNNRVIITITAAELLEKYQNNFSNRYEITYKEAITIKENDAIKIQLILKNINAEQRNQEVFCYFDFILLIQPK